MKKFEYDVTKHDAESLGRSVYVCAEDGTCSPDAGAAAGPEALRAILNERGAQGWELVQLAFGRGGVMAVWKRETKASK